MPRPPQKSILLILDASDRKGVAVALGPRERWTPVLAGASDRLLLELAGNLLGNGGSSGPGYTYVKYNGGSKPELQLFPRGAPSRRIAGKDLAAVIRELYAIPDPERLPTVFGD